MQAMGVALATLRLNILFYDYFKMQCTSRSDCTPTTLQIYCYLQQTWTNINIFCFCVYFFHLVFLLTSYLFILLFLSLYKRGSMCNYKISLAARPIWISFSVKILVGLMKDCNYFRGGSYVLFGPFLKVENQAALLK